MECFSSITFILEILFTLGYIAISFEHVIRQDKSAVALLLAVILWTVIFVHGCTEAAYPLKALNEHLQGISQIIFFLLGALCIVETINIYNGFGAIARFLSVRSSMTFLWLIGFATFFLSSVLDNLTTTIVMVSLMSQIIPKSEERLLYGGAIVIAANAGGAWTPIGDVTTTMLWIGEQISAGQIMASLFLPSVACLVFALLAIRPRLNKNLTFDISEKTTEIQPFGSSVLFVGVTTLIFVPIFKLITGLPPFMGIILGVSVLWLYTDFLHNRSANNSNHLKMYEVFKRIDLASIFFFLGILLSVAALETSGVLKAIATWLDQHIGNIEIIAIAIGLASAVVDNVPLVAASMGMYSLESYPQNSTFWELVAYCAGTGGSILIIGSAAGVVYMGLERVNFIWYLRKISFPALVGYFGGIGVYYLQRLLF